MKNPFTRFYPAILIGVLFLLPTGNARGDIVLTNAGFDEYHSQYDPTPPPGWNFSSGEKTTTTAWVTIGLENYLSLGVKEHISPFNSAKVGINNLWDSDTAYLWQNFEATPFFTYEANAYLKSITGISPEYEYLTKGFALRGGAKAWISLRWLDSNGNIISTKDSGYLDGVSTAWQKFSVIDEAPSSAASGDILLNIFTPPISGYTRVAYFDDASIKVIPEPSTALLLPLGLAGFRFFKKRKK